MVNIKLHIKFFFNEVVFLVISKLVANVILETGFIGMCIERTSSKTGIIPPGNSIPVANVDETRCNQTLTISVENITEKTRNKLHEDSCVSTRVTKISPTSGTMVKVKAP